LHIILPPVTLILIYTVIILIIDSKVNEISADLCNKRNIADSMKKEANGYEIKKKRRERI